MEDGRVLAAAIPLLLAVLACATPSGPGTIPAGTDQGNWSSR